MAPHNNTESFPNGMTITIGGACDGLEPSAGLIDLLITARSEYDWPANTGADISQQTIIDLEQSASTAIRALNDLNAHQLCIDVSGWAGNNTNSHNNIVNASDADKAEMRRSIEDLVTVGREHIGINRLCGLPGISGVIASKIFRFSSPTIGAAVDRHASYFFNSLPLSNNQFATNFNRQWANGRHTASRLNIYSPSSLKQNMREYFESYLPLLAGIANCLNGRNRLYHCAATGLMKEWLPADVEMAAYYWWACHGAR